MYPRMVVRETIGDIFSVAFAPDGETIAAAGVREDEDGEKHRGIFLWNISEADDISSTPVVNTHGDVVFSLEYSPDGRYFATGASNGTVRLCNATDNSSAILMTSNGSTVYSWVAFSPNGKILASASVDGSVRLWSVEDGGDGSCLIELLGHHEGGAYSVAFSPDGQTIASIEAISQPP